MAGRRIYAQLFCLLIGFSSSRRVTLSNKIKNELLFINLSAVTGSRFSNTATSPSRNHCLQAYGDSTQTSKRQINMTKLKYKIGFTLSLFIFYSSGLTAQIQVSKESHHKKVLENKYVRLLDVWITPGDTTLFHIHSTPSLFLYFTNTDVGTQILGQGWTKNRNEMGKASYRSFANDTLVHRVSNLGTSLFHVTDVELLSSYKPNIPIQPLPFTVIFDNEKAIAYKLTESSLDKNIISNRRPIIAELVEGHEVVYHDVSKKKTTSILSGKHLYIKPNSSFYFTAKENENINLVVFEIK